MMKKKHILPFVALALVAPIMVGCGPTSSTTNSEDISQTVGNVVKINTTFNKEGGSVSYAQGEYKVGDILVLKIEINKGYSLAKVTANDEVIRPTKDVYKITLNSEIVDICVVFEKNPILMTDFKFKLNEEKLTATIIEYKPDRAIVPYPFIVPDTVTISDKTYTIDSIANTAFNTSTLEAIKLSKNIVNIELDTFTNVYGLTSILVDEENQYFASYDNCLYSKDLTSLIAVPCEYLNKTLKIKDGTKTVKHSACMNTRLIENMIVPDSVTSIEESAFASMRSLITATLSKNIKEIPVKCFANDVELKSIVIPEGVEILKEFSFNFCPVLESVTFPSTLKEIQKESFYNCEKLGTINLNEGLKVIGKSAFGAILSLTSITMPSTLIRLEDAAFETCSNLRTVKLNEGLEYLGGAVFILNPYIKEVVIPASVKEIHYNPFIGTGKGELKLAPGNENFVMKDGVLYNKDLSKLISFPYNLQPENLEFRIPDHVSVLGFNCFSMNIYLKKLIIPTSVTKMYCAFQEILPSEGSGNYELELHYEGTREQFNKIDAGVYDWNFKANFKNNVVHCSDGFIQLKPNTGR